MKISSLIYTAAHNYSGAVKYTGVAATLFKNRPQGLTEEKIAGGKGVKRNMPFMNIVI